MRSYLSLAWKELKAQRVTSILILIAVILSTVMTTVVGQSIGILQSMRVSQAASLNGDRYVTFHQLSQKQAQTLSEDRIYLSAIQPFARSHSKGKQYHAPAVG